MKKMSLETFCSSTVALFVTIPSFVYMILEKGFPWQFYLAVLGGCILYLIIYRLRGGNTFDELTRLIEKEENPDKLAFYKGCREANRESGMGIYLIAIIGLGAISVVLQLVDYFLPAISCALVIGYCLMGLIKTIRQRIPEDSEPTVEQIVAEMNDEFRANAARVHYN